MDPASFQLDALRASDGTTIWSYQAQNQESAAPTLHVFADAERVYLANTFNNSGFEAASLEVRNGANGKVLWRYPYQRQYALFTLMNGVVYIGSSSSFQPAKPEAKKGSVCVFQASTGAKFWCLQTTTHVFRLTIGA